MKKRYLTNEEITFRIAEIVSDGVKQHAAIYGVPRGGIAPAYWIAGAVEGTVVDNPINADIIVDDLIDTGTTMDRYKELYPDTPFYFLYDHTDKPKDEWLVFPWEVTDQGNDESATDIFTRLLEYIGEDPTREGLLETPKRMAKMWVEITTGYNQDPSEYFKTFEENANDYNQMVLLDPIPYFSMCEHHLLPFFGTVSIAYIPWKKFAGLSKFARVVDTYSRRIQIQERMTHEIAHCIKDHINPLGVAVVVRGRHLCMEMRGVQKPCVNTTTSAVTGVFFEDARARNEFLHLMMRR